MLTVAQYVEFAGGDDDAWDADEPNGTANGVRLPDPKAAQQHGKSLEALLAAKNKRILEELTKFRVCTNFSVIHSLIAADHARRA